MTFEEMLDQVIAMLQRRGRVSYRALMRQFTLDEAYLDDLKEAILFAHPQIIDEEGRGLVWMGDAGAIPPPTPASPQPMGQPVTLVPSAGQIAGPPSNHRSLKPNGVSLPCYFATWLIRPGSPASLTRKSCVRWCGPIKRPAPR